MLVGRAENAYESKELCAQMKILVICVHSFSARVQCHSPCPLVIMHGARSWKKQLKNSLYFVLRKDFLVVCFRYLHSSFFIRFRNFFKSR